MTLIAPQPVETSMQSPLGEIAPMTRHRFSPSPLNRRRWQNFKSNRRGYWSFWIFLILFFISLFAELIANDRPFLIKFDGKLRLNTQLALNDKVRRQLFAPIRENFQPLVEPAGYAAVDFKVSGSVERPKTDLMDKLVGRDLRDGALHVAHHPGNVDLHHRHLDAEQRRAHRRA